MQILKQRLIKGLNKISKKYKVSNKKGSTIVDPFFMYSSDESDFSLNIQTAASANNLAGYIATHITR
jgi:hypothetical protein